MPSVRVSNGDDLIVDFCKRHQRRSSDTDNTHGDSDGEVTSMKTVKRQVKFSEDIVVRYFQYPSRDEVFKRWHSKSDKHFFTHEMTRDVRCIRFLLSTTLAEAIEKETLYKCVGLEALLSAKVTRALKERKRGYVHTIVEMQDSINEELLAAYAETKSLQSRERAQKLAVGYFEILS